MGYDSELKGTSAAQSRLQGLKGLTPCSQWFNQQHGLSGHVWANRFYSTPLDDDHLWTAVRYVELNPVRAAMCADAHSYAWSSAATHCALAQPRNCGHGGFHWNSSPFPGTVTSTGWSDWLNRALNAEQVERIRKSTLTGRPCGSKDFITRLEAELERILQPQKSGRKPKHADEQDITSDLFAEQ